MPTLTERALGLEAERGVGPRSRLATALAEAPPKLRAQALDLIAAAKAKRVRSTTAAEVLTEALADHLPPGTVITDEMVRRHKVAET